MKKIYILGFALLASAFTFAQNREVAGTEKSWDRLELSEDRSDDTLAPASFTDACITNGFTVYTSNNGGYVNGHNGYGDIGAAQRFPLDGSAEIEGFMVWYGAIEVNGGTTLYAGSVMDKDGSTVLGAVGVPHGTSAIDTTSSGAAGWHVYTLSSPVNVTDTFFCAVAWTGGDDTVGVVSTTDPCGSNAHEIWSDGSMVAVNDGSSWGLNIDLGVLAMVNNLGYTGIFDTEVEDFGVYQNGTNLHVNGIAFDATIKEVNIHDMSGRIVKNWSVGDQWDNYTFDISNVPTGNYIISMNTSKGKYAQKFNLK